MENKDYWSSSSNDEGSIKISEDVIASIASIATAETEGVFDLASGLTNDITQKIKGQNLSRGVKVDFEGNKVELDIYYTVKSGNNIFEVSKKIQENVKIAVESMTGLMMSTANIHVASIKFD